MKDLGHRGPSLEMHYRHSDNDFFLDSQLK